METTTILLIAIMALMLLGVAFLVYSFIRSILAKRAYEREALPDLYEAEIEDVVLPDIEESGFSTVNADYETDEESAVDIYRELDGEVETRRSRRAK